MLKYGAIAILFLGCTFIGFKQGEKFKTRLVSLAEFKKAVLLLNNEVLFYNTTLPEAFLKICSKLKSPLNSLFEALAKRLNEDDSESVYEEFMGLYESYRDELKLKKEDLTILEDFFKSLGESGVYGQEKIFKFASESLAANYLEADTDAKKNIKMYRTLGICSGAMLAIFFI